MVASAYTVTITDLAGSTQVADLPVSTLMFSKTLNSPGAASFALPMRHASATYANLRPLARRVLIYEDGNLRWGGDIWTLAADSATQTLEVSCMGYLERFRHRFFAQNLYYKAVEQFDIAWGIIDYTQDRSNLYITRDGGETPSTITRNRHFCAWESGSIADALTDLATANDGFDFEMTPEKVWTVWYPYRGQVTPQKTFTFGDSPDDTTNVWELRFSDDGTDVANSLAGIPDDECLDVSDFVVKDDATSQSAYGLLEDSIDLPNIHMKEDRESYVNEELRLRRWSQREFTITTPEMPWDTTTYEVGDNVDLTADLGVVNYSAEDFRVITWEAHVEQGQEWAAVTMNGDTIT